MHGHIGDRKKNALVTHSYSFENKPRLILLCKYYILPSMAFIICTQVFLIASNSGKIVIFAFLLGFSSPYN